MSANRFGEVQTTPRAKVRAAPAQDVYGKSRVVEADVTDWASDDDVIPAESEEQRPLLRRQAVRTSAVTMRQKAAIRFDDVGERNRLGALRARHLHATPRSSPRRCPGRRFVPTGREEPDTIGGTPFVCWALNGRGNAERTITGETSAREEPRLNQRRIGLNTRVINSIETSIQGVHAKCMVIANTRRRA